MNRFIAGAAIAVCLAGSAAYAADSTTTVPSPTVEAPMAPAATPAPTTLEARTTECASLTTQWDTAEAANAAHAKLAKAQTSAAKAKVNCAAETSSALKKSGITQYKASLKLLGVTATK